MNWKKFKSLFKTEKTDETYFIIGLDLGNSTSAVAFFDVSRNTPEIIDLSGGYGKPSVPTVMQYICDTKEWVFGEYAVLNRGETQDIFLSSLIEKLGNKEYIEVDSKPVSIVNILSIYLKELLGSIKNINPKAEIVGIVVSVSSYLGEEAKEELLWAFKSAGYEKELISLVPDRECIFAKYYFKREVTKNKILLLDYGSRELRGGVYDILPSAQSIGISSKASMFDKTLGTDKVDEIVGRIILQMYCANTNISPSRLTSKIKEQVSAFAYQHKDLLFQKSILHKPIRMYFNFAYPPFQQTVSKSEADEIIKPLRKEFISFVNRVLNNNSVTSIQSGDIGDVICVGGGFEMLWARDTVAEIFRGSNIVFYKNSKCAIAEGAAIVAAEKLGVLHENEFKIDDGNQIFKDIGIKVLKDRKEKFIPIIERNSFWWQSHAPKFLLINEKTDKPVEIQLFERDSEGEVKLISNMNLSGIPNRPRGTTKIKMSLQYLNNTELEVTIADYGFGEFFPRTDYVKKFIVNTHSRVKRS